MSPAHAFAQLCSIEMTLRASEALATAALEEVAHLDNAAADKIGAGIEQLAAARLWLSQWRATLAGAAERS